MFDSPRSPVGLALNQLAAARQALAAVDMAALSRDELLELVAALEIDTRQRAAVTHALIAEVDTRGVAAELGYTSTPVLLSERLRIGRREAAQRPGGLGPCPAPGDVRAAVAGPVPEGRCGSGGGNRLHPARGTDLPDC